MMCDHNILWLKTGTEYAVPVFSALFSGKADEFPAKPGENGQNHKKNNN